MIKIFLICKNDAFFRTIKPVLDEYDILISGVCTTPENAINMFAKSGSDLIVLDENWPARQISGIDILKDFLEYDKLVKVIFDTTFFEDGLAKKIKEIGAKGYFYRSTKSFKGIFNCITNVYHGKRFFIGKRIA